MSSVAIDKLIFLLTKIAIRRQPCTWLSETVYNLILEPVTNSLSLKEYTKYVE